MNAIQVQINENIRMLDKLKDRWARDKEEEGRIKILPTHHTIATIQLRIPKLLAPNTPLEPLDLLMVMLIPRH